MPAYKFEALNAAGKTTTGLLEADNLKAARSQLRAQSLVPLDVTQVPLEGDELVQQRFERLAAVFAIAVDQPQHA